MLCPCCESFWSVLDKRFSGLRAYCCYTDECSNPQYSTKHFFVGSQSL